MGTWIVTGVLFALVVVSVKAMRKRKRKGGCGCGCSCGSCPDCSLTQEKKVQTEQKNKG